MEQEKIMSELTQAIQTIRDKQTVLENAKITKEVAQAEIKAMIDPITTKLDQLEVQYKKLSTKTDGTKEKSPEHKAFLDYLRFGQVSELLRKANPLETKVLKLSDATTGGYLSTPEVSDELIKNIVEFSPIRSIARVRTTGKESVLVRKRTGSFSASWVGEVGTKSETTGLKYGLEQLPVHEMYALVDISNWDLEDSDFDLEAELNTEFAEQFGVAEGTAFVSGNSVAKPEGILTNADVGSVVSGSAAALTADGFFKLYFEPKSAYANNCRWIMRRATMLAASILKDSQNNYLLRRLGESPVWNILGADVVECPDMPAVAADAYAVAFGDFKQGYLIVDRIAIAVLRDPFSAATSNAVRFHARKRVGGQVIKAEAIKKMKISA